ncbi:MAG: penicillin-binding transpeptidase domain-containing protein [Patescibacteria group bacterium]
MIIDPDEIFLDAYNLPAFDRQQFEGELEQPIKKSAVFILTMVFVLIVLVFFGRTYYLQIINGQTFATRSATNTLRQTQLFPERGVIYDRWGQELVWNNPERTYLSTTGFAHLLGYVGYPSADELSVYNFDPRELIGRDGAEKTYNQRLLGQKGTLIEEVDAYGKIQSSYSLRPPQIGESLYLSIDARLQNKLFELIKTLAHERGFAGGAGVILDVKNGELLTLVSYPEYAPQVIARGEDNETIKRWFTDPAKPFLNRAIAGLYAPGSTIKPLIAVGALNEGVITLDKKITSTGTLVVPNPYVPDRPSIFRDWKAHGATDLREALAVSSDVYFYEVGGGFEDQPGLGIARIDQYAKAFGLGTPTGINWPTEKAGVIPTPDWKAKFFPGDPWRVGDTYHTAIGQYGFQVTPLQMARAIAAIANGGYLITPTILAASSTIVLPKSRLIEIPIKPEVFPIVREGLRLAVTNGTAGGLNVPYVDIAAKTGTAELGTTKEAVNSWVIGFFPYDQPRYAFAVTMERGHRENTVGGVFIMRQFFDWLADTAPEYLKSISQVDAAD